MSNELWHPELTITTALAKQLIEIQCPSLSPITTVELIGSGWDNTVFLVNNHFIFRFPHRKIANELIQRENQILHHLQTEFDLQIPAPQYIGSPDNQYPYYFHGYPQIPGTAGSHANLSAQHRADSIIPLAKFLKKLHSIPVTQAIAFGAKPSVYDRTRVDQVVLNLCNWIEKIKAKAIAPINDKIVQDELSLVKNIALPDQSVLIHGDLYCRHLMFDQQKLTGIIDWGDVGLNNPAIDLSVIFSFYEHTAQQQFILHYGEVAPSIWTYARFLGLYSAIAILLYGHDVADQHLIHESINAINKINPALLIN